MIPLQVYKKLYFSLKEHKRVEEDIALHLQDCLADKYIAHTAKHVKNPLNYAQKNFFSILFLATYKAIGISPERRHFYGMLNHCLRGIVTGADNILDNEYKELLPLSFPEPAIRFKSVMHILLFARFIVRITQAMEEQKLLESVDASLLQDVFGQAVVKKIPISGLFATGLSSFDRSHIYLPLKTLQKFLAVEDEVTEIALWTNPEKAAAIATSLQADAKAGKFKVTPWQELTPDLVQLIDLNDATYKFLVLIIFFIVAMGIANTMNSVIFERFREFGTIAAIGTTPAEIVALVSLESLFLGLFACLTGTVTALLACGYLHVHGIDLSSFTSSNQYFAAGAILKAQVLGKDVVTANLTTLLTALFAGCYPAIKAALLNPVDALNYT